MKKAFLKIPSIHIAVRIPISAPAVHLAVLELPLIHTAVRKPKSAPAVPL
eukprot:CAMPEP_0172073522 /NCGR_PEP_ID=MMETSP1043-20130122/14902_1 /TAXON_ID=464988 /ORGANISM="Hemiselmis andersenii, Strain CCMP441" /LENGTH=49 /DNA_ID= /DNA_START= /DNA_END= /DNA_ORIENTATION=